MKHSEIEWLQQGSPTFLKLRATSSVPINANGYYFDAHFWNKNFAQFTFNYLSVDHANDIFRTGPRVTYMVLAGDLVPAGTTLVTPGLQALVFHARLWVLFLLPVRHLSHHVLFPIFLLSLHMHIWIRYISLNFLHCWFSAWGNLNGSSLLCSHYTSGWTRPWTPLKKHPGSAYEHCPWPCTVSAVNHYTGQCWFDCYITSPL